MLSTDRNTTGSMLKTPYYYTQKGYDGRGCIDGPLANYDPYLLRCLKTRLLPILNSRIDRGVSYSIYVDKSEDNLIHLYLKLLKGGKPISVNDQDHEYLQQQVDIITSINPDDCILFNCVDLPTNDGYIISRSWLMIMLPYINITNSFYTYHKDGNIYANLREFEEFSQVYDTLQLELFNTFEQMFSQGYVVDPPEFIINNWQLEQINDKLYRPMWYEPRLLLNNNMLSGFLLDRYENNYDLYVPLLHNQNNWVVKHNIVKLLNKNISNLSQIKFYMDKIKLTTSLNTGFTYKLALQILAIIDCAKDHTQGQVLYFSSVSRKVVSIYKNKAEQIGLSDISICVDDIDEYIMTILIPMESNRKELEKIITKNSYTVICKYQG